MRPIPVEDAEFQSTPSVWRETRSPCSMSKSNAFQSTPSVWRETWQDVIVLPIPQFQSTPSVWRETTLIGTLATVWGDFNPLPPCGGRPAQSL